MTREEIKEAAQSALDAIRSIPDGRIKPSIPARPRTPAEQARADALDGARLGAAENALAGILDEENAHLVTYWLIGVSPAQLMEAIYKDQLHKFMRANGSTCEGMLERLAS